MTKAVLTKQKSLSHREGRDGSVGRVAMGDQ